MAKESIALTKNCSKCGEELPLDAFHKSKLGKHGRRSDCKPCVARRVKVTHRIYRIKNKEVLKNRNKIWRDENADTLKQKKREYYKKNRKKVVAKSLRWIAENKEKRRDAQQKWRDNNRAKVRASQKKARAKFRLTPKGRLHLSVGSTLRACLKTKKGGKRTFAALGYSVLDLMRHLEAQFVPGMTWDNYGIKGWHVDHIVPIAAHNFESVDDIDFKRAWALSNLRPLWAHENHKKSKSLLAPFQPSLLLREKIINVSDCSSCGPEGT